MTTQAQQHTDDVAPTVNGGAGTAASRLLPSATPIRFLDDAGGVAPAADHGAYESPPIELLLEAYRRMVVGRRFDAQATALTKQGRLAVYPSSHGQEACQIGGRARAARHRLAVPDLPRVDGAGRPRHRPGRGADAAARRLALRLRPASPLAPRRSARRWPPSCPHAVGLAYAARRRGDDTVALAFVGDGGTSEGDFHEALNFAAVFQAPVVFLVQNNRYAISVPLAKQTAAPSLAHKGVGYGIPASRSTATTRWRCTPCSADAVEAARAGDGPVPCRGAHLPDRGPHQRRRRDPLPRRRRGRGLAGARPARSARGLPHSDRRARPTRTSAPPGRRPRRSPRRLRDAHERRPGTSIPGTCSTTSTPSRHRSCASSATWLVEELAADKDDSGSEHR